MNLEEVKYLILEAFGEAEEESADTPETNHFLDLPKSMQKSIISRYGVSEWPEHDFLSTDMKTLFRTISKDKVTGSIGHKIISLPSFDGLYKDYSDIIDDLKELMRSDDIRTDKAARELFELIRTNFRKLQTYLRTERPEQYSLMKMRRSMEEAVTGLKRLKYDNLSEAVYLKEIEKEEPEPEEPADMDAPKETVLEDATTTILGKFPTLQKAIIKLQTEQFKEFVDTVDWVSPRPTSFRVNLKNGQHYILKWTGTGFEAQIMGKRYYIDKIDEYQQALDKLTRLYQEGPMKGAGEGAEAEDTGGGGGGGGDFPGEEGGAEGSEEGEAEIPAGDDIPAEPADLGGEEIDFEDGAEPE